jgi:hypothetical protein
MIAFDEEGLFYKMMRRHPTQTAKSGVPDEGVPALFFSEGSCGINVQNKEHAL